MEAAPHPVLNCPLLRDAVYRNRTSSRALRHNIALSCVPVAMLPVVAPWLPPWDVVPPEAALRGLRSLEIVYRSGPAAQHLHNVVSGVADTMASIAPLTSVTSLALRIPIATFVGYDEFRVRSAHLRRIVRCLPNLQSLALSDPGTYTHVTSIYPGARPEHLQVERRVDVDEPQDRHLELAPRLTSLGLRGGGVDDVLAASLLLESLLCSRMSLRTLAAQDGCVISVLANEYSGTSPRLASSQPRWKRFTAEEAESLYVEMGYRGTIPARCLGLHSPAWTLRSVTVEKSGAQLDPLPTEDLCRFILACPVLRFLKLSWLGYDTCSQWGDDLSSETSVHADIQSAVRAAILRVEGAVREKHPALRHLSPAHHAALTSMVSEGTHPAALLFVFARGFELTTLARVDVCGALGGRTSTVVEAAVEAARLLRRAPLEAK